MAKKHTLYTRSYESDYSISGYDDIEAGPAPKVTYVQKTREIESHASGTVQNVRQANSSANIHPCRVKQKPNYAIFEKANSDRLKQNPKKAAAGKVVCDDVLDEGIAEKPLSSSSSDTENSVRSQPTFIKKGRPFSYEEDRALARFMSRKNRFLLTGGLEVWKLAADKRICPGRTFWSLRERFIKYLWKRVSEFLEPERARLVTQFMKATSNGKRRYREEVGCYHHARVMYPLLDEMMAEPPRPRVQQETYFISTDEEDNIRSTVEPAAGASTTAKTSDKCVVMEKKTKEGNRKSASTVGTKKVHLHRGASGGRGPTTRSSGGAEEMENLDNDVRLKVNSGRSVVVHAQVEVSTSGLKHSEIDKNQCPSPVINLPRRKKFKQAMRTRQLSPEEDQPKPSLTSAQARPPSVTSERSSPSSADQRRAAAQTVDRSSSSRSDQRTATHIAERSSPSSADPRRAATQTFERSSPSRSDQRRAAAQTVERSSPSRSDPRRATHIAERSSPSSADQRRSLSHTAERSSPLRADERRPPSTSPQPRPLSSTAERSSPSKETPRKACGVPNVSPAGKVNSPPPFSQSSDIISGTSCEHDSPRNFLNLKRKPVGSVEVSLAGCTSNHDKISPEDPECSKGRKQSRIEDSSEAIPGYVDQSLGLVDNIVTSQQNVLPREADTWELEEDDNSQSLLETRKSNLKRSVAQFRPVPQRTKKSKPQMFSFKTMMKLSHRERKAFAAILQKLDYARKCARKNRNRRKIQQRKQECTAMVTENVVESRSAELSRRPDDNPGKNEESSEDELRLVIGNYVVVEDNAHIADAEESLEGEQRIGSEDVSEQEDDNKMDTEEGEQRLGSEDVSEEEDENKMDGEESLEDQQRIGSEDVSEEKNDERSDAEGTPVDVRRLVRDNEEEAEVEDCKSMSGSQEEVMTSSNDGAPSTPNLLDKVAAIFYKSRASIYKS